jgi:c-di-GMP-binding flagellar brake protein YcgR
VKMAREKRKYKRYIFPNDEKMMVSLSLSGNSSSIEARLLNVSEGGLGLAVDREQTHGVEVDSELSIKGLENVPQLQGLREAELKVRWVLDHNPLKNLGIGCEFTKLPENGKENIFDLIKSGKLKLAL